MSEETPKVDPKYYKPSGSPKLAPAAQKAFSGLLWTGLVIVFIGVLLMMLVTMQAGVSIAGIGVPFLVGAGIVAGLGARASE